MNPEATLSAAQPPAAKPFFTPMVVIGLILNAISLLLFLLPYWNPELRGQDLFSDDGALFWANYLMAALYFIALLIRGIFQKRWKFMLLPRAEYLLALSLFSISAFALNLNMQLFATFAGWAQVAIVLMHVALIGFCLVDRLPAWLRYPLFGLMGLSTVMALYFTLCLLPLMPIGVIGAILFGISLHAIAPLVFLITLIVQFWRNQNNAWDIASYTTGIVLPFLVLGVFLVRWNNVAEAIHDARASIVTRPDNTLPTWVLLAQQLPGDAFTEKVLTSRLVYQKVDLFDWNFDRRLNNTFDDLNRHDPMVNIARLFFADIRLDDEQLLKVVSARFDARHESHRKLWPGANLLTSDVFNEIQVMPDYRMAYLEKTIVIHYDSRERRRRWNNQEEALYTFYLPEGAVATSLSLWVNGEERKSRLSTRNKADSAYSTIVGRFRRDPALLHWQEGNRLTVTVFPCTPEEDRQFKIGLTVPLEHREDRLVLKNVYFRGPSIQNARETSVVRFVGENPPANPNLPSGFDANGVGEYLYSGSYQAYWEADFPVTPLSEKPFAFLGKSYHLEPWTPREEAFDPQEIYLDLNARWEASEVDAVLTLAGDRKVYAFDDRLITVTAQNRKLITDKLLKRGFSLFPLETVKHPTRALMVSKSEVLSPNLKEMDGTKFVERFKSYTAKELPPLRCFHLGSELSPYHKTLKDFHLVNYVRGEMGELAQLVREGRFPAAVEAEDQVVLQQAGVAIVREVDSTAVAQAPTHLLRLFAYDQLLQKMGPHYFNQNGDYVTDELIGIANEAYVVSPISSLIVLETQEDYERFDIPENENSLQNASRNDAGSVPEPHEWALIVMTLLFLGWLYRKHTNLDFSGRA